MQKEYIGFEIDDELEALKNTIQKYYRYKASLEYVDIDKRELHYVLYQAFKVVFSLEERSSTFGAGILISSDCYISNNILGEEISLNSDTKSVINSLRIIDEYVKLRLPDKYLAEFKRRMESSYYDFLG